mgnify:CR=1 FL=1
MRPLKFLRDLWRGVQDQITLILLTAIVNKLSKLSQTKLTALAHTVNVKTDAQWGEKANLLQRAVAENLELVVREFRT